LINRFIDVTLH